MNIIAFSSIIFIWVCGYCLITKHAGLKRKVKLFLRQRFNDSNEVIWTYLISAYYVLFPCTTLFFVNMNAISELIENAAKNFSINILVGLVGFIASLTISTVFLDIGNLSSRFDYSEMNSVGWIMSVRNTIPLIGVFAAIVEEFFQRFFIPFILFGFGNELKFLVGIIISSIIFSMLQVMYVSTYTQRFVIIAACFSISSVSILAMLITSNILSSIIIHGLYVFSFMGKPKAKVESVSY